MAKSTKSYEERMLEMEKKEQESLEKAKRYAAQKKELLKRKMCIRDRHMGVSRRTASVSADKHNIVPLCVLVNIPGKKKSQMCIRDSP